MGLFRRNKKEKKNNEYVVTEERLTEITHDGVEVQVGMGVHGADEIVAGAMMGNTGKLIAMSNYGKLKYTDNRLYFNEDSIMFRTGEKFMFDEIYRWEKRNVSFIHAEFSLITTSGEIPLKATNKDFLAIIKLFEIIPAEYYEKMEAMEQEAEAEKENAKNESDMDRLIRLGELHERGLLSDEEFQEAKEKLLKWCLI